MKYTLLLLALAFVACVLGAPTTTQTEVKILDTDMAAMGLDSDKVAIANDEKHFAGVKGCSGTCAGTTCKACQAETGCKFTWNAANKPGPLGGGCGSAVLEAATGKGSCGCDA